MICKKCLEETLKLQNSNESSALIKGIESVLKESLDLNDKNLISM